MQALSIQFCFPADRAIFRMAAASPAPRLSARACGVALALCMFGAAAPAFALDGRDTPATDKGPVQALTFKDPATAWKRYQEGARAGDARSSLEALRYAADGGQPLAQWKLGTMYAAGEGGVPRDDLKAFQYFSRIVDAYDEDDPDQRRDAAVVASAFVSVGAFSLTGIANTSVHANPERAMEMFYYAATRFRDANAQYNLARMYLDGAGVEKDVRQAARWLNLAADKDHKEARALLGSMLFKGTAGLSRQRPLGLMYLTLAREAANDAKKDGWIVDLHESAVKAASDDEKSLARHFLEDYLNRSSPNPRAPLRYSAGVGGAGVLPPASIPAPGPPARIGLSE
jgi:TPR repeat protein